MDFIWWCTSGWTDPTPRTSWENSDVCIAANEPIDKITFIRIHEIEKHLRWNVGPWQNSLLDGHWVSCNCICKTNACCVTIAQSTTKNRNNSLEPVNSIFNAIKLHTKSIQERWSIEIPLHRTKIFWDMRGELYTTAALKSWGIPLRLLQFAFAASVMSLAAYTLSTYKDWTEVRFTVAAVLHTP